MQTTIMLVKATTPIINKIIAQVGNILTSFVGKVVSVFSSKN